MISLWQVMETNFPLSDTVFANANVAKPQTVGLWLGADVMVQYTLDEAIALLTRNLETAEHNLNNTLEDLAWLRDQHTVSEVNMARLHNWEVKERRKRG